jgi:bacteriocin-like protein
VHEESLSEIHLVLPAAEEELSDADLEQVSGGGCWDDEGCPTDA